MRGDRESFPISPELEALKHRGDAVIAETRRIIHEMHSDAARLRREMAPWRIAMRKET